MEIKKYWKEIIIALLITASSIIIKLSGFSVMKIVVSQFTILIGMLLKTNGMGILKSIGLVLKPFVYPIISAVMISMAIGISATMKNYKKIFVAGIMSMILFFIFIHSLMGIIVAFGIFLSIIISPKSRRMSLLVLNLAISIGVFIVILNNTAVYQNAFRDEMKNMIRPIVIGEVSNIQNKTVSMAVDVLEGEKQQLIYSIQQSNYQDKGALIYDVNKNFENIEKNYVSSNVSINYDKYIDAAIDNSPMFSSMMKWFPVFMFLTTLFIMQFLESILLNPVSLIMEKIMKKKEKS